MTSHGVILAVLTGIVAGLAVEVFQVSQIVKASQRDGVRVALPGLGNVLVKPPEGGEGETVQLPTSARRIQRDMHAKAGAVAAVAVVVVIALGRK